MFLDAVDKEDARVYVVVHLYEHCIKECGRVNAYLEILARRHAHTKFLRMVASTAKKDLDPIALPMLVIYRKGEVRLRSDYSIN